MGRQLSEGGLGTCLEACLHSKRTVVTKTYVCVCIYIYLVARVGLIDYRGWQKSFLALTTEAVPLSGISI